ncbi:MAG: peptidase domain-containing ABC transporter [Lysobacteraceae bacterium]|nr:MAG: peptidase domain-containing ABC transporter [Xanthomonadaceae bacterium]
MSRRARHGRSGELPLIRQDEIAECGLACIAMIAAFHGHDLNMAGMRRRFAVSIRGATLSRLIAIADRLDLSARPLRADPEHLPDLRMPCILHWDMNHFVVLKKIGRGTAELHDPARGAITMPIAELGRHFTGVALELTPNEDFNPVRTREPLRLRALVGAVSGWRRALTQVLALALALELFTLLLPMSMQWVIDQVLVTADAELLTLLALGFLAAVIFQSAIAAVRGWVVADIAAAFEAQWSSHLAGHLLRLPLTFFVKRSVGEVLSRFQSVQSVQQTLSTSFVEALLDGLTVILVLALLLVYSPTLTAWVVAGFALYALIRAWTYRRLWRLKEDHLASLARQQSLLVESVHGVQAIKLANRHAERHARLSNAAHDAARQDAAVRRATATFSALSKLLFGAQRILLIWLGARMALEGAMSAGTLVLCVAYADMFSARAGAMIDKGIDLRLLGVHARRIADIAQQPPERDRIGDYAGPPPQPSLDVEGLGFRYGEDEPWVVRDCSFRVDAGESVAIVGPSGAGKTTLAKLLLGLLPAEEGTVRIGGVDIARYGLSAFRARIGAVMQDDALFAGSIADNIAFFDGDARPEAVIAAARRAGIHDEIAAMPMGYETLVGDMGSALSGGQKQRVLLARALFREPDILLLDEATSHLDIARERSINTEIAALRVTRLIIAHRPETISSADRVLMIESGRVRTWSQMQYRSYSMAGADPANAAPTNADPTNADPANIDADALTGN